MTMVIARHFSAMNGLVKRQPDQRNIRRAEMASFPLESMKYLQHLSALQDAGVLTDEEVSAAKLRLFGP